MIATIYQNQEYNAKPVFLNAVKARKATKFIAKKISAIMTYIILLRRYFITSSLYRQKARGRAKATLTYCPMKRACYIMKHC